MKNKKNGALKLEARWDLDVCPSDRGSSRGLIIDLSAEGAPKSSERDPVNVSLVLDRSGSMSGGKIEAAKEAAIGVVDRLDGTDVLSLVVFDTEIITLAEALPMDAAGKAQVRAAIGELHSRGMTDLGGGWFEGARCCSIGVDRGEFRSGHVIVLSDGRANHGLTDPEVLLKHASELAARGITTSAVGVGDSYSPLQLDALAEGGSGRLHDAEDPEEIIEVILGELGEIKSVIAADVHLAITWPKTMVGRILSRYRVFGDQAGVTVCLGQLRGSSRRTVPVLFDVPALPQGETLRVGLELTGKSPHAEVELDKVAGIAELRVVSADECRGAPRNGEVARRISLLWESAIGFDAMELNEQGDLTGASLRIEEAAAQLGYFSNGTGVEEEIRRNLDRARRRVSSGWHGRSKREAMVAAKKFMRNESDHRSDPKGVWTDKL